MLNRVFSAAVVAVSTIGLSVPALAEASLSERVDDLRVSAEHESGYDRDAFGEYDRDALLAANFDAWPNCDGYYSHYDGQCYEVGGGTSKKEADDNVDVDHIVALAEAWHSGAYKWGPAKLDRFGGDTANLTLLTSSVNRHDKSDHDVTGWVAPRATCHFVDVVVDVKLKYNLAVDRAEKAKLKALAGNCDGSGDGPKGGSDQPKDYNCPDFTYQEQAQAAFDRHSEDIYRLDADGDGQACESLPSKPVSGNGGESDGEPTDDGKPAPAPEPEPVEGDLAVTG